VTTVVVLAVAVAGWWLVRPAPAPVEAVLPAASGASAGGPGGSPPVTADPDGAPGGRPAPAGGAAGGTGADPTPTPAPPPVVVQAAGAVHRPGVHRLAAGSRVDDLVRAAGGATAEADLDRVNLAAPLVDGERVWVPRRGETEVPPVVGGGGGPASGGSAAGAPGGVGGAPGTGDAPAAPGAPVDLNAATAADLDALPGIGPATAAAILAHRDANGPFRSVDDLLDVRGIGEAKLEQLRPLVTV
jgi:competence protein ComEA